MGLLSIFTRNRKPPVAAGAETGDAVKEARTRAHRRLIGATVLLVAGVIGFPLVFETRPRPIPIDVPIEIPKREGAPALTMPPARSDGMAGSAANAEPGADNTGARGEEVITESSAEAGREVAPRSAGPAASAIQRPPANPTTRAAGSSATATAPAVASASAAAREGGTSGRSSAATAATAAPARATLPTDAASAPSGGRFIVQVGAFAEADSARQARAKVEKLGLKTYTQVAQTPSGSRIRVRLGPFSSRAEADTALAKARAAGLTAVVLTL